MTHASGAAAQLISDKIKEKRMTYFDVSQSFTPPVSAQFISNLSMGISPVPKNRIKDLSKILGIEIDTLADAMVEDYRSVLYNAIDSSESRA